MVMGQAVPGRQELPSPPLPPGQAPVRPHPERVGSLKHPQTVPPLQESSGRSVVPGASIEVAESLEGAHPKPTVAAWGKGIHIVAGQALHHLGTSLRGAADQPLVGAHPGGGGDFAHRNGIDLGPGKAMGFVQGAPAPLVQGDHPVAPGSHPERGLGGGQGQQGKDGGGQALVQGLPALPFEVPEPGIVGPTPHHDPPIGPQGVAQAPRGVEAPKALGGIMKRPGTAVPTNQAHPPATGPDVVPAFGPRHLQHIVHILAHKAFLGPQHPPAVPFQGGQPFGGGTPEPAFTLQSGHLPQPPDGARTAARIHPRPDPSPEGDHPGPSRAHPEGGDAGPVKGLPQGVHTVGGQLLPRQELGPGALLVPQQPRILGAEPEAPVPGGLNGANVARGEARRHGQGHPFPPPQVGRPLLGARPEATRGIQGEGVHGRIRQPLLHPIDPQGRPSPLIGGLSPQPHREEESEEEGHGRAEHGGPWGFRVRPQPQRRARQRRMRALVEASWSSSGDSGAISSGRIRPARALPNSTPHWSKGFRSQRAPWVKVWCS